MIDYLGHDAEGRLLPNAEFQAGIAAYYGASFRRPTWWDNPAVRCQAFDSAPPERLSAEDRELLLELLRILRGAAEKPEEKRDFDMPRHAEETQVTADAIFQRAKDGQPMSDLDWMQTSSAASCGLPAPRRAAAFDGRRGYSDPPRPVAARPGASLRQRRGSQNLQAAYDSIYRGVARK